MTSIGNAGIRFNTGRDEIVRVLDEIAAEWADLGIDTPVINEAGEIDPDALDELSARL